MIVKLFRDELFPYFVLRDSGWNALLVDLDEQQVEWIEQTLKEFDKVQDLLGAIYYGNYA